MKKLLASFLIVIMSFGLVACGASNNALDEKAVAQFEAKSDYIINFVNEGMEQDTIDEYLNMREEKLNFLLTYTDINGSELRTSAADFKKILKSWKSAEEDFGEFVSKEAFSISETNQGIEVSCEAKFENRDATITLIYDEDQYITTLNVNGHYSGGEIAKKAGLNTLLGMGTVFVMLIFISFVIYLFNYLPGGPKSRARKAAKKASEAKEATKEAEKPAVTAPVAPVVKSNDEELVAAITAAISAYTGKSGDSFVVRSIKRKGSR